MDKGVENRHKSHITVSGREGAADLILKPGLNRLTSEQYRQIRKVPIINRYFDPHVRLLMDVPLPAKPAAPAPAPQGNDDDDVERDDGKPLERMNKDELTAAARELGVEVSESDTK